MSEIEEAAQPTSHPDDSVSPRPAVSALEPESSMEQSLNPNTFETTSRSINSSCSTLDQKTISSHIISVIKPVVGQINVEVERVSSSQVALEAQLDLLLDTLKAIQINNQLIDLADEKHKKLLSLKRRLTLINTILQNCNDRCKKLITYANIQLESQGSN